MPIHRYVTQIQPDHYDQNTVQELDRILKENGGRNLPAPLIFPPMFIFEVEKDAVAKIKEIKAFQNPIRFDDQGERED